MAKHLIIFTTVVAASASVVRSSLLPWFRGWKSTKKMRLSFLAFYATVVSVAEGSALRGLIDEVEGENSFDAESRTSTADSPPEQQRKKTEDVDSRPFLHERPRKADLPLFSRILASLDYRKNVNEYDLCEGDCDENDDCANGLKCFQRDGYKSVPGCNGNGRENVDYCIKEDDDDDDDDDKLDRCEGDCDRDEDCAGDLVCFQRDGFTKIPGCDKKGTEDRDYCIRESDKEEEDNKLDRCEGDCDRDEDCAGDLVCFQRDGFTKIPGCDKKGTEDRDYCIRESDKDDDDDDGDDDDDDDDDLSGRLEMVCDPDDEWQGSRDCPRWCLQISSCNAGATTRIQECSSSSRQKWRMDGDVLRPKCSSSLCVADGAVEKCSTEVNLDFKSSSTFEIRRNGRCFNQDHDPRRGEPCTFRSCSSARKNGTNKWMFN